ncbi:MAG TPA: pitrilysin family protein [Trueperaceae bacterium]
MTVDTNSSIRTRRLDNGVTLVFEPMPWLRSLSLALLLPVGSVTDPRGREGSATVLFDWLSRGAGGMDSREFNDRLDTLGVRRGGGAGRETTNFTASMLASALPEALPLLADMVRRPELDEGEFASARELALQELASLDDSPAQRLGELLSAHYFTSAHGRSAYGTREGLESLDPAGLAEDFRSRYAPEGAVIAAAGGVRWEELSALAEEAFGGWQGSPPAMPAVEVETPRRHHVAAETSQVQIGLAYPGLPPQHSDWYRHTLAMNVLSGGTASRLFSEVREKRGLAYSVHAGARAVRGYGYVVARAGTTPERADETLDVMLDEIARLGQGVDADELERARTGILSHLVMQGESSGARAAALAHDLYLRGEPRSLAQIKAMVSTVSLNDVNSFLAMQSPPRPTVLTLGPNGSAPS